MQRNLVDTNQALLFGRFQILEELGAGFQGRVVRALDRATGQEVALKIPLLSGGEQIERFKAEFRALAGLIHPNLVRLGELFEEKYLWAFSMEIVRGQDFVSWVRSASGTAACDVRLRDALAQAAFALQAVHDLCLIHRDVKPANVRVTPEGRVVLMDFGLVAEQGPSARTASLQVVGTVGYMAPELAAGEVAGETADLYALGVMLYEALTGVLPYEGAMVQVALAQRAGPPPRPLSIAPEIAPDLDALCMELLAFDPHKRPSARAVRARLGCEESSEGRDNVELKHDVLFGRERELSWLEQHCRPFDSKSLRSVVIEGQSGVGKSALVAAFVRRVRVAERALVILSGSCHPAEHVSYNAFDDIFDDIARVLVRIPEAERAAILPDRGHLLPTLSPALAKIPGLRVDPGRQPHEVERTHLFDAFLELLANLGARRPLLICIDDLQWANTDSVQLMKAMLDRKNELPFALVATARRRDAGDEPTPASALLDDPRLVSLRLAPLEAQAAHALVSHLLEAQTGGARAQSAESLVDDAAGSPLFLIEVARARARRRDLVSLDDLLRERMEELPGGAQMALRLICVARAPVSTGLLFAALETSVQELYGTLSLLRRTRLVSQTPGGELVCYHDRVREALLGTLSASLVAELHRALAGAFELDNFQNPLRAAQNWLLAGEPARAAPWLTLAAKRAMESAAFEMAAGLFRQRLDLREPPLAEDERRALQVGLADALSAAGHCSESSRILLAALEGAGPEERRTLSLRAAQQLLQAGALDAGMHAAERAMAEVGLAWRGGSTPALLHLGVQRLQIVAARTGLFAAQRTDPALVERQLDTILHLTHPLAWSDSLRSMELSSRGLLLSLRQGMSDYLPMLLAAEAVQVTTREPGSGLGQNLLAEATGWLRNGGSSRERAYCAWARGATAVLRTRYAEAEGSLLEAERTYEQECPGEAWMQVNTRGMLLNTWLGLGEHPRFVARSEALIREAQAKGDAYAQAYYSVGGQAAFRHALSDEPERGLSEVERVMEPWRSSWGLHVFLRLKTLHDLLSYAGGERAHLWWSEQRRLSFAVPAFFAEGFAWRRADAALRAVIARGGGRAQLERSARLLRPLARASTTYVRAFAGITAMQIALLLGDYAEGRQIARTVCADVAAQDDYRTQIYQILNVRLSEARRPQPSMWGGLTAWLKERGWKNPVRALSWVAPMASLEDAPPGRAAGPRA